MSSKLGTQKEKKKHILIWTSPFLIWTILILSLIYDGQILQRRIDLLRNALPGVVLCHQPCNEEEHGETAVDPLGSGPPPRADALDIL